LGNCGLIGAFSSTSGKADTVLDTNGQILYYNNGRKALDKEDNDDVLTLKSGLPSWEAPSAGGATVTVQAITPTNAQTTTSTSLVDIDNCTITSPVRSGGFLSWIIFASVQNDTTGQSIGIGVEINGSDKSSAQHTPYAAGNNAIIMSDATDDLDGGDIVGRWHAGGGTAKISSGSTVFSEANTFEVS